MRAVLARAIVAGMNLTDAKEALVYRDMLRVTLARLADAERTVDGLRAKLAAMREDLRRFTRETTCPSS